MEHQFDNNEGIEAVFPSIVLGMGKQLHHLETATDPLGEVPELSCKTFQLFQEETVLDHKQTFSERKFYLYKSAFT